MRYKLVLAGGAFFGVGLMFLGSHAGAFSAHVQLLGIGLFIETFLELGGLGNGEEAPIPIKR